MEKQTAGRKQLGKFAPKFAELNDDILFGEVWANEDKLSIKNRCMITIAGLIGKGGLDSSFKYHLINAKNNGITKEEIVEIITHLAFYCGWPNAWAAFNMAKEVYTENEEKIESHGGMFGLGDPNTAYAQYFVGNSYLKPLAKTDNVSIAYEILSIAKKDKATFWLYALLIAMIVFIFSMAWLSLMLFIAVVAIKKLGKWILN